LPLLKFQPSYVTGEVVLVLSAIMFVAVYFQKQTGQISGRFRLCL